MMAEDTLIMCHRIDLFRLVVRFGPSSVNHLVVVIYLVKSQAKCILEIATLSFLSHNLDARIAISKNAIIIYFIDCTPRFHASIL